MFDPEKGKHWADCVVGPEHTMLQRAPDPRPVAVPVAVVVPAERRSEDVFVVATLAAQRLHDVSAPRDTRHRALRARGHVGVATHVHVAGGAGGEILDERRLLDEHVLHVRLGRAGLARVCDVVLGDAALCEGHGRLVPQQLAALVAAAKEQRGRPERTGAEVTRLLGAREQEAAEGGGARAGCDHQHGRGRVRRQAERAARLERELERHAGLQAGEVARGKASEPPPAVACVVPDARDDERKLVRARLRRRGDGVVTRLGARCVRAQRVDDGCAAAQSTRRGRERREELKEVSNARTSVREPERKRLRVCHHLMQLGCVVVVRRVVCELKQQSSRRRLEQGEVLAKRGAVGRRHRERQLPLELEGRRKRDSQTFPARRRHALTNRFEVKDVVRRHSEVRRDNINVVRPQLGVDFDVIARRVRSLQRRTSRLAARRTREVELDQPRRVRKRGRLQQLGVLLEHTDAQRERSARLPRVLQQRPVDVDRTPAQFALGSRRRQQLLDDRTKPSAEGAELVGHLIAARVRHKLLHRWRRACAQRRVELVTATIVARVRRATAAVECDRCRAHRLAQDARTLRVVFFCVQRRTEHLATTGQVA
eukprot:scaffold53559_cov66-Phaeocystis_antarctica.AAC.8